MSSPSLLLLFFPPFSSPLQMASLTLSISSPLVYSKQLRAWWVLPFMAILQPCWKHTNTTACCPPAPPGMDGVCMRSDRMVVGEAYSVSAKSNSYPFSWADRGCVGQRFLWVSSLLKKKKKKLLLKVFRLHWHTHTHMHAEADKAGRCEWMRPAVRPKLEQAWWKGERFEICVRCHVFKALFINK